MGNKTPITCFTVDENKKAEIHQVTIDALLGSTHFKWRYINPFLFFKIQKKCKQAGIKHIIIEHPYMGWLGILLKKFAGVTLIIRSHNIEGLRFKSIHKWWWKILFVYEKLVHKMADLSLFITQEDFDYAVTHYKTSASKSMVATYGIEEAEPTPFSEKIKAKENICIKYGLDNHTKIFLFNGSLNYKPNTDAVQEIIEKINPLLLNQKLHYKVIICGKGLPDSLNPLNNHHNIIYAGFVDSIAEYVQAADIFINPVIDGGGIKTKLVEALAANTTCISYQSGAIGVPQSITGNKLILVKDMDSNTFVDELLKKTNSPNVDTPEVFFDYFNWSNIAQKIMLRIEKL